MMKSVLVASAVALASGAAGRRSRMGASFSVCTAARHREGACFDEGAPPPPACFGDDALDLEMADGRCVAASRSRDDDGGDAIIADLLFLEEFLDGLAAPAADAESVEHLRATIQAQKRRLRRCRAAEVDLDDLVRETLRDLPPEAQGIREEWARKTGWGAREPVRA